jgi:hypothetical protein
MGTGGYGPRTAGGHEGRPYVGHGLQATGDDNPRAGSLDSSAAGATMCFVTTVARRP